MKVQYEKARTFSLFSLKEVDCSKCKFSVCTQFYHIKSKLHIELNGVL